MLADVAATDLRDEVTDLLQRLIRVDTTNPPGNETAAAELLRDYLAANGVESQLIAKIPERANLVARLPGSGGPSLLLLCHTDVVYAELPKLGRKVAQGEACAVIESVKAAFDIYAPISGEVIAVNEVLAKDPALVNRSPQEEGWLFKLKPSKPGEENSLMDFAKYQEFLKSPAANAGH